MGIDAKRSAAADAVDAPFTFAQVKLASHAALQRGNPQLCARMLSLLVPAALALNNGLGRTPARGWNAWNSIRCEGLNENLIREVADAMVR